MQSYRSFLTNLFLCYSVSFASLFLSNDVLVIFFVSWNVIICELVLFHCVYLKAFRTHSTEKPTYATYVSMRRIEVVKVLSYETSHDSHKYIC